MDDTRSNKMPTKERKHLHLNNDILKHRPTKIMGEKLMSNINIYFSSFTNIYFLKLLSTVMKSTSCCNSYNSLGNPC